MASSAPENFSERFSPLVGEFLAARLIVGEAMLPAFYPDPEGFDALQIGFRSHGVTGKSLVAQTTGAWQPGWYVIALNALDDPFIIDAGDRDSGYPVYYAPHGAGRWDATPIAPNLSRFAEILSALQHVEDNSERFSAALEAETDISNPFWHEVQIARAEAESENLRETLGATYDLKDYEDGHLIVTDPGQNKLQVVQVVSKALGLPLKQALALAAAGEFTAGSGSHIQLRRLRDQLEALGSKVEFRPAS
ncbi:hypothetical protein KX729_08885 [Rhizobium sp. XQZ8]|uniref:hypothetical protein n=1 Tax=Rhizobium populisoli TaxID=2859785 RepID=UPI001CA5C641|nr:hypothetical protein [Rhizobium populisoli]MBW6421554.1 hypothetical protein [Rhizobium populisoli]